MKQNKSKYRRTNIIANLVMILLAVSFSCNRDEVFEKEQYKNVFALISESDNITHKFHALGEESIGYVAASLGGTNPTNKDIHIRLAEDRSLIDEYNIVNYDVDVSKYVNVLPESKVMHPLTKNKLRTMAGNETYVSDINVFNKSAIVMEIADDNKVTITPYKNIEVMQIDNDPDYPNIFKVENDGFKTYKTFLLRYNYKMENTWYEMKEELRLEFDPNEDARL
ncbi:MAG: DUF4361 domain-containing protein [Dysgonamonadaceae bacterium]|jgi:hypothetical protein|nr:DUF4361 domain-containing protein [Dysgonamonadaceae bacterium]